MITVDTEENPESRLVGRWRIITADIWDIDYLDLVGPAQLTIRDDGAGEISFGALHAHLDCAYSRNIVNFDWSGADEMDEVRGEGSAELLDDGMIEIEFRYDQGDEALLTARRW